MRLRIAGATCVLPTGPEKVDLLLENGKIAHVGVPVGATYHQTLNASGMHILPGVIDDQVHFREPGLTHKEDLETASRACAKGGVTTYFEMPNTSPTTTTVERLHEKLALAATKSRVNYAFFIGATPDNVAELRRAERTPGIKIFIGSSTGDLLVDGQDSLERIFAETTLPITAHCEDEATVKANRVALDGLGRTLHPADHIRVRDHAAAVIALERALDLSRRHRHRFHVLHVTTAQEVALLREAKQDPVLAPLLSAEACHPHLFFTDADYPCLGTLLLQNPSVKTKVDQEALWAGLREGTLDFVATDHAPHTLEEKAQPYPKAPSGMPSIENALSLMLHAVHLGRCTLTQVMEWTSLRPAMAWDLEGKGRIAEGYDADLVLVDLNRPNLILNEQQLSKCGWSPWHGETLMGTPVHTLLAGRTVYADGRVDDDVRGTEVRFAR